MKMHVLETERTSSPNVNITAYIQPRGASRSNGTFQRLCETLWSQTDGAPNPKELLVALKPKSLFVRQKVLGANIHQTEGLLERNIASYSGISAVGLELETHASNGSKIHPCVFELSCALVWICTFKVVHLVRLAADVNFVAIYWCVNIVFS